MTAVAIIDDDPNVRAGLSNQVQLAPDKFTVIGTFATVEEFLEHEGAKDVDVVLLDVLKGDGRLNEDLTALCGIDAKILIVTVDTKAEDIVPALRRHQVSIVHKNDIFDDAVLHLVIAQVAKGARIVDPEAQANLNDDLPMPRLTPRQEDVLRQVLTGSPTNKIAQALHIRPQSPWEAYAYAR